MSAAWCRTLLLGALLAWPLSTSARTATQGAAISVEPAEVEVGEGLTAAVQVRVEGVQALYALDIRLAFDPSVVQVVDADPAAPGVQVQPGDLLRLDLVARNTVDNANGLVWFAMTQVNPSPEVNGSGVAFTVTFTGRAQGTQSALAIAKATLATRDGRAIPAAGQGGTIRVVARAAAPATPTTAPTALRPALERTASAPAPTATRTEVPTATEVAGATSTLPAEPPMAGQGIAPAAMLLAGAAGCGLVLSVDVWRRWRSRRRRM